MPPEARLAVSVLMPAFRSRDCLADSVASVRAQRFADWELLIIADDGEDYAPLLQAAGLGGDGRIRLISSGGHGLGPAAARNRGLAAARGDIIATLDHDDRWRPEHLARMLPLAQAHGATCCAVRCIDSGGVELLRVGDRLAEGLIGMEVYFRHLLSTSTMLMFDRRRVGFGWPELLPEDQLFAARCLDRLGAVYHLPGLAIGHVKHAGSLSASRSRTLLADKQVMLATVEDYVAQASSRAVFRDFLRRAIAAERAFADRPDRAMIYEHFALAQVV